jgi:hypothetical protein
LAVARDVADEKVSVGAALERYGVALTADGSVDVGETEALRRERRQRDHEG